MTNQLLPSRIINEPNINNYPEYKANLSIQENIDNKYDIGTNCPNLINNITKNSLYEKEKLECENQIDYNLNKDIPLQKEISQRNMAKINDIEYKNYLEYIKQKELLEKEREYEEYLKQKELMLREKKEKQNYNYNMNQNLQNFHTFINTAEDYKNKQKSYIDSYAENLENQKREFEYKRNQEQKVLTKENMELFAQQQENNKFKNDLPQLPFDRFQEEREEYLNNKKKNISTYSNLTSMTTTNPSLKNDPNVMPYVDPEKAYEMKLKEEKMKKYKRELDEQIRTRPQEAYGRINNDRRIEVPPDPCKYN